MLEKTNLVMANRSNSLRVTVPANIVKQFDLKVGDAMGWGITAENNALKISITPIKKDE